MKKLLKKFLPQTLFGRSLLIMVTPVLLLQLSVAVFFFDRHWDDMTERLAEAVAGEIEFILKVRQSPLMSDEEKSFIYDDALERLGFTVLFEPDVKLEDRSRDATLIPSEIDVFEADLGRVIDNPFTIHVNRDEKWYEVLIMENDGLLRIMFPERRLYSSTTYLFILWLIGSSIILFAIAIVFMRNQISPIRKLVMAEDRFGRGIDVPKFKPHGAREVRQAAEAFLDMRERIQRQIEQRTDMLSGVSHDLRTPITRMKLQIELMGDSPDVEALRTDLAEMEQMVEGYLAFVRGDFDERHGAVDISQLLKSTVAKLRRQMLTIEELSVEEGHIVRVRQNAIERVLTNIFTNACKYGTQAWVSLYQSGSFVEITVDDDGPGIPEDEKEAVFKPFYRMEQSRNTETGGVGLGLSVAQDIIHNHGGEILLETSNRGGLRVIIRLPIN